MSTRMKTYTAFCQESDRTGTTWIDTVQATTVPAAQKRAIAACAAEWGGWPKADIVCYCLIEGHVTVALFED